MSTPVTIGTTGTLTAVGVTNLDAPNSSVTFSCTGPDGTSVFSEAAGTNVFGSWQYTFSTSSGLQPGIYTYSAYATGDGGQVTGTVKTSNMLIASPTFLVWQQWGGQPWLAEKESTPATHNANGTVATWNPGPDGLYDYDMCWAAAASDVLPGRVGGT